MARDTRIAECVIAAQTGIARDARSYSTAEIASAR